MKIIDCMTGVKEKLNSYEIGRKKYKACGLGNIGADILAVMIIWLSRIGTLAKSKRKLSLICYRTFVNLRQVSFHRPMLKGIDILTELQCSGQLLGVLSIRR